MYTHYFSLIYPLHIQLKEEAILEFRFRNVRSSIMINRHRSSLGILDLFNSFERSGKVATNKNYTIERNSIFGPTAYLSTSSDHTDAHWEMSQQPTWTG